MNPVTSVKHNESRTIAFRVTYEDYKKIQLLADISGMLKQDYLRDRCLDIKITVHPNIRVQRYLELYLQDVLKELKRIHKVADLDGETLEKLNILIDVISQL